MTAGTTDVILSNRALGDIGTRSKITSLDTSIDTSTEAYYCNLYYSGIRNFILRAANWNFAGRTGILQLWKALPGTPENPTAVTLSGWSPAYPAPPWVYSYIVPSDSLRPRTLIGQPQQVPIAPPIFSGSQGTNPPISQRLPMARFEVAADFYDQAGNLASLTTGLATITSISGGLGYNPGDFVTLLGGIFGIPAVVQVLQAPGGAPSLLSIARRGTYTADPTNPIEQLSTTGTGSGLLVNGTFTSNTSPQEVILTQQEFALLSYTFLCTNEAVWDSMFEDAFVSALAARLAQPLTGDKALARDKYNLANAIITNARVADGNEGLTINDHLPDWIRTRGVGGGLGYEMFFYPLGPLFPIAPLV